MARFALYFVVANLIGGFFLWLTARSLPVDEVWDYFKGVDGGRLALWSAAFVAVYALSHAARVVRWYELVRPLDGAEDVAPARVHRASAVGFMAIMLLPLRLGELVRPYYLSRNTALSASALLGTAVVERVMDGLAMTALLFITLATYSGGRATTFATGTGLVAAAIFSGALGMCLLAWWRRALAMRVIQRCFGWLSQGLADKLAGMLGEFIEGFRALLRAHTLGRFLGLTLIYWGANAASLWLLARFGFGLDVGLWDMTTVLAMLVIGLMVPAGPAMAGNFEFFVTRALGLFVALEVTSQAASVGAFAATLHVLQFLVIILPGVLVMWLDPQARNLISLSSEANDALG